MHTSTRRSNLSHVTYLIYDIHFSSFFLEPTAPPTNVTAYSTSSLSIIVHWGVVPQQHRNGHILGYRTCYHKASDPPSSKLCVPTYALSNHLGSLKPYTPYYITVIAYTNVGDGPSSKPLLVWTDQFGE